MKTVHIAILSAIAITTTLVVIMGNHSNNRPKTSVLRSTSSSRANNLLLEDPDMSDFGKNMIEIVQYRGNYIIF